MRGMNFVKIWRNLFLLGVAIYLFVPFRRLGFDSVYARNSFLVILLLPIAAVALGCTMVIWYLNAVALKLREKRFR